MDQYKVIKVIGDGTFGTVTKAVDLRTEGEVVAIKKMKKKFLSWEECMQLREIKSLKKLAHPNIVKLKEVIRVNDMLHLVFEFVESDLYTVVKARSGSLSEAEIQSILYQTLQGVAYTHRNGFFHRDLKPENLLINTIVGPTGPTYIVKICDFGQAREIRSTPPYTEYIATRWYRAPECLLRSNVYNSPMDMFAIGCIMAELYLGRPLFPGSSESDQLFKICSVLGTPTQATWPEGLRLGSKIGYQFPNFVATPLSALIPQASKEALDLLTSLLRFDPQKRVTAAHALAHPYFASFPGKDLAPAEFRGPKQTPEFSTVITEELGQKPKKGEQATQRGKKEGKDPLNDSSGEDSNKSLTKYSLNSSFESIANQSKGFHKTGSSGKSSKSHAKLPAMPPDLDDISDLLDSNVSTPFSRRPPHPIVGGDSDPANDVLHSERKEVVPTDKREPADDILLSQCKEEKKSPKPSIKRRSDRDRQRFDMQKEELGLGKLAGKKDDNEEQKLGSPQIGGSKFISSMWNLDPMEPKGVRNEPIKPRRQLPKTIMPSVPMPGPAPMPPPQPEPYSALSGESNFSYHKKHLGAAIASNSGVTGSGLRAAARDTYKKEVQHSFLDHNSPMGGFPLGQETGTKGKIDDALLYMPLEQPSTDPYKMSQFGFGGPGTQPASGPKFQCNYGRYKYQQ